MQFIQKIKQLPPFCYGSVCEKATVALAFGMNLTTIERVTF